MNARIRIPLRLKILVSVLLLVTAVVSVITFTMANLFDDDKRAYLHDLGSILALSTAEECGSLLHSYAERLTAYARVMTEPALDRENKGRLVRGFFDDMPELVSVRLVVDGEEVGAATNQAVLEAAGLAREELLRETERSLPPIDSLAAGEVWVRNTSSSTALPTLTLVVAAGSEADSPATVVSTILLDGLQRIAARSRGFEVFLVDADGVLLGHQDAQRVAARERQTLDPRVAAIHGEHSRGLTLEYEEAGESWIAGFAAVDLGGITAVARTPRSVAYLAARQLLDRLLLAALALLLAATVASFLWARRVARPLERLADATRVVAQGRFDVGVSVTSRDEIGSLATAFNSMTGELRDREVALQKAQAQLIQSEKLAAFGQLGAGIAHEVKNPLAGILGCAQLSLRKVEAGSAIQKNLQLIEKETQRCKEIIENLLKFARQEKAEFRTIALNPVVQDVIEIVDHQLSMHKVSVESQLSDDLPEIQGNANQLQQVLMNLMINAQQALAGAPGKVRLETRRLDSGHVEIRVSDTGPGMSPEVRDRLFEPFFTTKPGGKGTGLGLSVSYGIVKDHGGDITVDGEEGQGATFLITLPAIDPALRQDAGSR